MSNIDEVRREVAQERLHEAEIQLRQVSARIYRVPWWRRLLSWIRVRRIAPLPVTEDAVPSLTKETIITQAPVMPDSEGAEHEEEPPARPLTRHTDRHGLPCHHSPDAYRACIRCGRLDEDITYPEAT